MAITVKNVKIHDELSEESENEKIRHYWVEQTTEWDRNKPYEISTTKTPVAYYWEDLRKGCDYLIFEVSKSPLSEDDLAILAEYSDFVNYEFRENSTRKPDFVIGLWRNFIGIKEVSLSSTGSEPYE